MKHVRSKTPEPLDACENLFPSRSVLEKDSGHLFVLLILSVGHAATRSVFSDIEAVLVHDTHSEG